MTDEYEENRSFEADVRRTAEAIWGLAPGECQPEHYHNNLAIRELDGIARLRDITHLLMATVSRRLDKTKEDVRKLLAAERVEQERGVPVSKWLVTKYQLEAEHANFARKNAVKTLTLDNFRNRFFDGREYLLKRRKAAFGSARNLADGTVSISEDEYVPLPMTEVSSSAAGISSVLGVVDVAERLAKGDVFVLLAPFGAGKSLTTREVFLRVARHYLKTETGPVPVTVNLREHWGQPHGDEILERHARSIGFGRREDMVVAWRAGIAAILLDGFDELASQVVARAENINFMREARHQSLEGVRDLVAHSPAGVGILVCGRDHYFDNAREMEHALALSGRKFTVIRLGEFNEDQAGVFLKKHGVTAPLPDWLPRKPLILGYLAHRGLLSEIVSIDGTQGFGHAWDQFLTLICQREAVHGLGVMDPDTLRRVLERLGSDVRATSSGTGPITGRELAEAYRLETAQVPGEGVLMQLQRLPGLTPREQDPGARSFIDEDLLAALQGSAVARFVLENVGGQAIAPWLSSLPDKGIAMAAYMLRKAGADTSTVIATGLRVIRGDGTRNYQPQVAADCMLVALEMAREDGYLDCRGTNLEGLMVGTLDLEDMRIENLSLRDCLVDEVVVGPRSRECTVTLRSCLIRRVSGVPSERGLPAAIFDQCTVDAYEDLSTNAAVIRSDMPDSLKALVTVLRKLYRQAGGGRKLGALRKGIPPGPILDAIDDVVQILESEGVVHVFGEVAHPVRRQSTRIMHILDAPELAQDAIVERARRIIK